jgi:hypothetical protein
MMLEIELVRGNERLQCDWLVWLKTTELAGAFGWTPISINPMQQSLSTSLDVSDGTEVAADDAQSLARVIKQCISVLAANQRPTRRQIAHLMMFQNGVEGSTIYVDPNEAARIAIFCLGGSFHMKARNA